MERISAISPHGWASRRAFFPAVEKRSSGLSPNRANRQLRTLLVVGASSIIKPAKRGVPLPPWLTGSMARKPTNWSRSRLPIRPLGSSGSACQGRLLRDVGGNSGSGLTSQEISASTAEKEHRCKRRDEPRRARTRYRIRRLTQWVLEPAKLIRRPQYRGTHHGQRSNTRIKGRTYDCPASPGSGLHKHLACRAVPRMRQSQKSAPIDKKTHGACLS